MNKNCCVRRLMGAIAYVVLVSALIGVPEVVVGQTKEPAKQPPSIAIKIEDLPRTVDPVTLLPPQLTKSVSVDFADGTLSDVVKWLQTEHKMGVVVEQDVLASEAVTDKLTNAPIYLLLDRLSTVGIGWYYEANVVHLTILEHAREQLSNVSYNVSDLLDAGYQANSLMEAISGTISPDSWLDNGGKGSVQILGDVLFVNQTREHQLQVAGLLTALRKHGRRTYISDSPSHEPLRAALASVISVDFRNVPLVIAIDRLAKQVKADIRLDQRSLRDANIRDRQPITLTMPDQKLNIILPAMLHRLGLTWIIRDGVIWVAAQDSKDEYLNMKTAVYDVRDLCRDHNEATALEDTVCNQLEADSWGYQGGKGQIYFPVPGVMTVSQPEAIHDRLLELLENYRAALRASKPRPRAGENQQEVITRYYRLPKTMADDLLSALPQLIQPETWRSDAKPEGVGTILKLASKSEWDSAATSKPNESKNESALIPYAVLVIRQTRAVHDLIPAVLQKIRTGDGEPVEGTGGGMGGGGFGGMGGGGFGGGFF